MEMTWEKLLCPVRWSKAEEAVVADPTLGADRLGLTAFDKDYGRAVFSSPVRRLQDKAQVFPMDPTDAVRTRLTHSMEVSSVARGLARSVTLIEQEAGRLDFDQSRAVETIVATCGLLHDIGNPPFGHAGESAISDWFLRNANLPKQVDSRDDTDDVLAGLQDDLRHDFLSFEGNAQTLRLVSKLQLLARDEGLNLTCGTLSALQKYVVASDKTSDATHSKKKPGYFRSEAEMVKVVRERTGVLPDARNPMTLLMEAADDICFAMVDIEDGIKKGVTSWCEVRRAIRNIDAARPLLTRTASYIKKNASNLEGTAAEQAKAQFFRVLFISEAVEAARDTFLEHREAIFAGGFEDELVTQGRFAELIAACKKFAKKNVYRNSETLKLELLGRRVISDLMDLYWTGAREAGPEGPEWEVRSGFAVKAFKLTSDNYRRVYRRACEQGKLPERYLRLQLVTDQVCGMTDGYACRVHQEVLGG